MLPDCDQESYTLHWRDARRARGEVQSHVALLKLFAGFDLPLVENEPPFHLENEIYLLSCRQKQEGATYPCNVSLELKPQSELQTAAWAFADDTQMARIERQSGELGVRFLDENVFVPFSKLSFDHQRGFSIHDG